MSKPEQHQNGFSVVEVLVVLVIVAALGLAGWLVYKNHHKAAPTAAVSNTSTAAAASTSPYTGWKLYCDTINNGCFKYPSTWALTSSNANGLVNVGVSSPGQTVTVVYKSLISGIGNSPQSSAAFYLASTNNLSASTPALKVVGGYFSSSTVPYYYLVNASSLTTYPLTAGQTGQFEALPDYSLEGSTNFGVFYAYTTQKAYSGSATQAQSWYATSNATNSLLVVQSFYYQ